MKRGAGRGETSLPMRVRSIHVALLALVTALVFSNTLNNEFHLDSIYRVEQNTEIAEFYPPSRFFTDLRTGSTIPQIAEYRPLMPLSHAIESEIARVVGGDRLAAFHVGNIVIHIGSVILAYCLFSVLIAGWGGRQPELALHRGHVAFAAALIFAVHPVAGSSVNYIAGRDLLLMVFFFLSSFLAYVYMRRSGDSWTGWIAALALLCLAILSKQAAIVAFGLVFLFEWILVGSRVSDWRLWARTAMFSLPTVGFFVLRSLWIIKQQPAAELRLPIDIWFPLTMAKAHLFYYLRNFVWPFEMRALARFDIVDSVADPGVLLGAAFIVASLALAFYLRNRRPLIAFAIVAYWLLFALTASIFPFRYVVTDYRQYLPSVFLCLGVSLAICYRAPGRVAVAVLGAMALYFGLASYHINGHWKTEESFWAQSVRYGGTALAHTNYGLAVGRRDAQLAEQHYLIALQQNPNHVYANINLGMLWISQSRVADGLALLRKATEQNPDWALTHYWLSRGLTAAGRSEEALRELVRAADLDPRRLEYQYEAAEALDQSGDRQGSIAYLERIARIDADYKLTGFRLAFAHQSTGNGSAAIAAYRRFLDTHPDHVQAHFNLAYALMKEGANESAIEHFRRVLVLRPAYAEAHLHLAHCFRALGEPALAERHEAEYRRRR